MWFRKADWYFVGCWNDKNNIRCIELIKWFCIAVLRKVLRMGWITGFFSIWKEQQRNLERIVTSNNSISVKSDYF